MHAGASLKPKYPLVTPQDLVELDGFIFGIPTRYGRAPAQVSAFFDKTGGLWAQQALAGKYVGTFTSTASQHGGQELTHLTTMPFWAHHGCIYVPIGYKAPYLQNNEEVHGGSPWGVSTVANGDGSRVPTKGELEVARWQGEVSTRSEGTQCPSQRTQIPMSTPLTSSTSPASSPRPSVAVSKSRLVADSTPYGVRSASSTIEESRAAVFMFCARAP